jgi:hypothetical protein
MHRFEARYLYQCCLSETAQRLAGRASQVADRVGDDELEARDETLIRLVEPTA